MACFTAQGFIIGTVGSLLGVIFATVCLAFRNQIVAFVAGIFNKEETLIRFYQFTHLPAHYQLNDFLVVVGSALVASTLAGLIPAVRASLMRPATALRSE